MTTRSCLDRPVWLLELHSTVLAGEPVERFLERVIELAKEVVPGSYACGIRLRGDNGALTVAGDEEARELDSRQDEIGSGPGQEALSDGRPRYVADLHDDERWPEFSLHAAGMGIRSVLVDVLAGPQQPPVGTLSLYSAQSDSFEQPSRSLVGRFAQNAGTAVALALAFAYQVELGKDLHRALSTRSVIDQAMGVIMAENRCGPEAAFGTLRRASMNRNIKVHDLAADLVRGVSGEPPSEPPFASRAVAGSRPTG